MSFVKGDHLLPAVQPVDFERKLAEEITRILHVEYEGVPSAVKRISLKTGIAVATIKKWYSGRNPPRMAHILMLAQCYPAVLVLLLKLSGHDYLSPYVLSPEQMSGSLETVPTLAEIAAVNVPINVLINSWPKDLNQRQVWFLTTLRREVKIMAADIARRWHVTEKTAKRDIAHLKAHGLIAYVGARKTGKYEYKGG